MQRIDAEDLLPHLQITVKGRKVLVHVIDKTVVHGDGDAVRIERAFEARRIFPRLHVEEMIVDVRRKLGTHRSAVVVEPVEERREDLFPVFPVRQRSREAEGRLIELARCAVAQGDVG
jgi:hypothetical protein